MKHSELSPEMRKRANARAYANVYLRRGKIVRGPCKTCGSAKAEMHHDDYSKPLQIEWLCRKCHIAEHGGATKVAKYGAGNCARCESPKLKNSGYCRKHRNEYSAMFSKKKSDELKTLRKMILEMENRLAEVVRDAHT